MSTRRIAIVGAGIAGLTTAIALRRIASTTRRPVDVELYERSPRLRTGGGALQLWSNAMLALDTLGLADELIAAGCIVERTEFRSWDGDVLSSLPIAELGRRVGQPSIVIRRGRLLQILARAAGIANIRFGHRFEGFRQTRAAVHLAFDTGLRDRVDLLIGADGLFSAVRAQLQGVEQVRSTHQAAWVGMAPLSLPSLPLGRTVATMGRGLRFAAAAAGDGETFWHATVPEAPTGTPRSQATLAALYRDGHEPMARLIETTSEDKVWRTMLVDRSPVSRWGLGRVTLVGDAAHPVTPDLGQGACQGIEDAIELARQLEIGDEITARAAYEARRRTRTARIAELSHATATLGMLEDPRWCEARDQGLQTILPVLAREHLGWILGP